LDTDTLKISIIGVFSLLLTMNKKAVFTLINTEAFFLHLCPGIKSWRHKLYGRNDVRVQPDFTDEDRRKINAALKRHFHNLQIK